MTNEQIIFIESVKLMEQGILKGTGQKIVVEYDEGKKELDVPEPIHTYQAWKNLGYQVKKGEKAIAKFTIWKHVHGKKKEDGEQGKDKMFMKMSSFFKMEQVEKMEVET